MSPADLAALKSRIEAALAESVQEFGEGEFSTHARVAIPFDRAWALCNIEDTRALLTDRAVKLIGGQGLAVSVDDEWIAIESPAAPKIGPPSDPREGVAVPADGVERVVHLS